MNTIYDAIAGVIVCLVLVLAGANLPNIMA